MSPLPANPLHRPGWLADGAARHLIVVTRAYVAAGSPAAKQTFIAGGWWGGGGMHDPHKR